eukprot:327405_1
MAVSTMFAIDDLINTFKTDKSPKTITVFKRVVKVETFSDDYNDFNMHELTQNKALMEQLLLMEQEESKNNNNDIIPSKKSYLPCDKELEMIKNNLSDIKDIEINEQSSIINYETKFQIDRFEFAIQFIILPKSYIHCWLGFIKTININMNKMRVPMGGIGGQQMGGPIPTTNVIKDHYLSNLMLSIPHRKPLSDEFGKTTMSSIALITSDIINDKNNTQMSHNDFMLSSNDLALKLSKILTKISKCTVQISVDIPSNILNAPILNRNRNDFNDTNMLFQIEKTVMNIYKNINTSKN